MSLLFSLSICCFGAATQPSISNAQAVSGTWVLQQVMDINDLQAQTPGLIEPTLATPAVRGLSLRVPWRAIDQNFDLLDAGLKIARARNLDFSVRFMAGRHSPDRLFDELKCPYYSLEPGNNVQLQKLTRVPRPFNPDGSPNIIFEKAYDEFVGRLAAWCRANNVRLLHLAWYGQDWAELNHGKEVRALEGYSEQAWYDAHLRLLDIGLSHAGDDMAVELPFSGYGPVWQFSQKFADHVIEKIGPWNPRFFCQSNGWSERGDWGAPNAETEANFDAIWRKPICRGEQAIQPWDFDWKGAYDLLYKNKATYCEIYCPSLLPMELKKNQKWIQARMAERNMQFQDPKDVLQPQIQQFAEYQKKCEGLPGKLNSSMAATQESSQ